MLERIRAELIGALKGGRRASSAQRGRLESRASRMKDEDAQKNMRRQSPKLLRIAGRGARTCGWNQGYPKTATGR